MLKGCLGLGLGKLHSQNPTGYNARGAPDLRASGTGKLGLEAIQGLSLRNTCGQAIPLGDRPVYKRVFELVGAG